MKTRIFFVILLVVSAFVGNAFANPFPSKVESQSQSGKSTEYGFSYSFEHARWYGLDARASYLDLLDNYHFSWVRLVFYWDEMTDDSGNLKIDDLKWAIEQADKRNIKVVMALGVKTPYYPEFHLPDNEKSKLKFADKITPSHLLAADVVEMDKKVVGELSAYDNIVYWQVENEPLLANIDQITVDEGLISEEIAAVRSVDSKKRPIALSNAARASYDKNYKKLLGLMSPGDILFVNAYFTTQNANIAAFKLAGLEIRIKWPNGFYWPVQSWLFLSPNYGAIIKDAKAAGVGVWVAEMQAEPYIRTLDDARGNVFSFNSADLAYADNFVRSVGFDHIGLWGASFWQYREKIGDDSWENAVKRLTTND